MYGMIKVLGLHVSYLNIILWSFKVIFNLSFECVEDPVCKLNLVTNMQYS